MHILLFYVDNIPLEYSDALRRVLIAVRDKLAELRNKGYHPIEHSPKLTTKPVLQSQNPVPRKDLQSTSLPINTPTSQTEIKKKVNNDNKKDSIQFEYDVIMFFYLVQMILMKRIL